MHHIYVGLSFLLPFPGPFFQKISRRVRLPCTIISSSSVSDLVDSCVGICAQVSPVQAAKWLKHSTPYTSNPLYSSHFPLFLYVKDIGFNRLWKQDGLLAKQSCLQHILRPKKHSKFGPLVLLSTTSCPPLSCWKVPDGALTEHTDWLPIQRGSPCCPRQGRP